MPRPANEYEALMADPLDQIDTYPADKLLELREAVLDAIARIEAILEPTTDSAP
jgi:hypothetical protein